MRGVAQSGQIIISESLVSKALRVDGFGAVLLQEVSGDVLESLRDHATVT
jgi:hypothetical protein